VELVQMLIDDMGDAERISAAVMTELAMSDGETEVMYRDGNRLVRRFENAQWGGAGESSEISATDGGLVEASTSRRGVSGGVFIITGGLGALGLLTAKVLSLQGASRLVLVSRSGKVSHEGQGLEEELRWLREESGCVVDVMQCDVSNESSVKDMILAVRRGGDGIRGIVHAAGVLRDALIRGGGAASGSDDVWRAKAQSAWYLHEHTLEDDLSYFVVFSSITAAIGSIGQSAYGASNMFLDSLVDHRVV
jgi:phthiocerol/phenolphthiocerol synthesis type-I polyketide synthase D